MADLFDLEQTAVGLKANRSERKESAIGDRQGGRNIGTAVVGHLPSGAIRGRLFRTGDLGFVRPDGNLDLLGRLDDQVKIRGMRIELGEIEAVLQEQENVTEAVVAARSLGDGDTRLVAF